MTVGASLALLKGPSDTFYFLASTCGVSITVYDLGSRRVLLFLLLFESLLPTFMIKSKSPLQKIFSS